MKLNLLFRNFRLLSKIKSFVFPIILLVTTSTAFAQTLTQAGFTGVTVPQFMASGTSSRMPVIFRGTVTGLTANTAYKYYCQGATNATTGGGTVDIGSTNSGAGNPILINAAGTAFTSPSSPSLVTSGSTCETFTTDASGNYTGWFGFINTGNARFTAGNIVYPTITFGIATGTVVQFRRALDLGITVLAFSVTAGATNGSLLQSTSSTTNAKNFSVLYDNVSGTGRPIAIGLIESIGSTIASVPSTYATTAGTWNVIIPNAITNGIRRIENRNISNTLLGCANDSDGTWPTGSINTTVSANSTTTAKVIATADAVLTACAGTTSITNSGTLTALNTVYGTASATTSYSVSGSGLTADILVTPPTGFEISQTSSTTGYAATQTLAQSSGSVASTTIYVRLAATTLFGTYSGNIVSSSAGATSVNTATASSTVDKKALTVTGASAINKVYDGTTAVTFSGATLAGTVNGDVITLTNAGSFNDKNIGTAKPVTTNFSVTGTNVSSYYVTQPTGLTANIDKKNVTISAAAANNKIYDGNTSVVLSGTLSGVVGTEDVSLILSGQFDSATVSITIPVTSTSTLSGVDSPNYNLVQPTTLVANIIPKELTIASAVAGNKVFDGNTNAVITGTLTGVIAPDNVNLLGTGTFASSAVGTGIAVTSTSTISGDITNYSLTQPNGLTANITSAPLVTQNITFTTLPVNFIYGNPTYTLFATSDSGLTVSFASSDTTIASVAGNLLTIKKVGAFSITATQSGDATYDAATPVVLLSEVLAKELTVTTPIAINKIYDGTDIATISGTLTGIVGTDVVSLVGTGFFDSFNVANGINVTSVSSLTGVDATNYYLTDPTGISANITPKPVTVSGATAANKVYDGATAATISGASLVGVINPDVVTVSGNGNFVNANVGTAIAVTSALVLSGANAVNYSLTQPTTLTANINKANVTISGLTGTDKVYDNLTTATISGTAVINGLIGADVVSVSGTIVADFNNKTVGTAKPITVSGYTLAGPQADNYNLTAQPTGLTANITKKDITISGVAAQNKEFDGTNVALITGTLVGVIAPNVVTLVGSGTFASSAVANGIAVTSTATLSGTDAVNYQINPQPTGLSANIIAGPTVLQVGDLSIIGFNTNAPDNFAFVTWVDLLPNTIIKFTDNGFLAATSANASNNVRGGENFVIWKNGATLLPAGTVITIQDNTTSAGTNNGSIVSGNLNGLSSSGDNIFAYQGAALTGVTPDYSSNANPTTFNGTLLFGLYAQGSSSVTNWLSTGISTSNNSYLPTQLNVANGNIVLASNASRSQYTGSRTSKVSMSEYRAEVNNSANWTTGSGAGVVTLNSVNFTLATPPTASVISGTASICQGNSTNINVAIAGGTSPFTLVYFNGTTNETVTGYVSGTNIAVSPIINTTYTIVSVTDANSLNGTGNTGTAIITVNPLLTWYADVDNDTFGNLAVTQIACTQPIGFVSNSTDCNDTNVNIYQSGTLFIDADNDGYANGTQVVCYGATAPAGFKLTSLGVDCNDANANVNPGKAEVAYNGIDDNCDGNLDEGFPLLTTKIPAALCGSTLPFMHSSVYSIHTPGATAARYRVKNLTTNAVQFLIKNGATTHHWFQFNTLSSYDYATSYEVDVELQVNGTWLGYYGLPCIINSPGFNATTPIGVATLNNANCGKILQTLHEVINANSVSGATGYRYEVTNLNTGLLLGTIDRTLSSFNLSMFGSQAVYGTPYSVRIAVKTTGNFGDFGPVCIINTPNATSLNGATCGLSTTTKWMSFNTDAKTAATTYRFKVVNLTTNAEQILDRTFTWFNFGMLTSIYALNTQFSVQVAYSTSPTTGTMVFSPYSEACTISSRSIITGSKNSNNDVSTRIDNVSNETFKTSVYPNPFTSDFAVNFTSNTDEKVAIKVYDMIGKLIESRNVALSASSNIKLGSEYPSGVYNVIINQADNIKAFRVIKK